MKSGYFTKIQKSRYLQCKTLFFLQIKKIHLLCINGYFVARKSFVAEAAFKEIQYVCVSGGKKCSFSGKFGVLCFLEIPLLKFALLPYYRQIKLTQRLRCFIHLPINVTFCILKIYFQVVTFSWFLYLSFCLWKELDLYEHIAVLLERNFEYLH